LVGIENVDRKVTLMDRTRITD